MTPSLILNLENYLNILFETASNLQHASLRKLSCESLKEILDKRRDLINANLERVLEALLRLTMDSDNQVRKEAVAFWNEFFIGAEGGDGIEDRPEILQNTLTM